MELSPEAGYMNVILNTSQMAMSTMDLEMLEYMYRVQKDRQDQGLLKMPVLLDHHPVMDKLLPLELEFLGKLIECIRIQREMAPLRYELHQHFLTLQRNVNLQ